MGLPLRNKYQRRADEHCEDEDDSTPLVPPRIPFFGGSCYPRRLRLSERLLWLAIAVGAGGTAQNQEYTKQQGDRDGEQEPTPPKGKLPLVDGHRLHRDEEQDNACFRAAGLLRVVGRSEKIRGPGPL